MSAVASKNLFDLLGNDIDSDGEPKPPTKVVVKQTTTTKKKDVVVDTPPPAAAAGRGGYKGDRRPRASGNDAAFRDRNAGRENNVARGTDEAGALPPRRGGRGGARGRGREYDRRSATGRTDSEKQVNQGWGSNDNEWVDEKLGEQIAQTEAQDENAPVATSAEATGEAEAAPVAPEEPEEKVKTYDDFLAEKAAKAAALGALPAARQPNEGSRNDTKWKNATPFKKDEEEEDVFIAGKEGKAKREKERKQKQIVEIDQRFQEAPRGGRGDRAGRGGRGGGDRGERRGGPRGGRDGGFRQGGHRGGNNAATINLEDNSAFPTLGS